MYFYPDIKDNQKQKTKNPRQESQTLNLNKHSVKSMGNFVNNDQGSTKGNNTSMIFDDILKSPKKKAMVSMSFNDIKNLPKIISNETQELQHPKKKIFYEHAGNNNNNQASHKIPMSALHYKSMSNIEHTTTKQNSKNNYSILNKIVAPPLDPTKEAHREKRFGKNADGGNHSKLMMSNKKLLKSVNCENKIKSNIELELS